MERPPAAGRARLVGPWQHDLRTRTASPWCSEDCRSAGLEAKHTLRNRAGAVSPCVISGNRQDLGGFPVSSAELEVDIHSYVAQVALELTILSSVSK